MIKTLIFNSHPFAYELERLARSFFPPIRLDLIYDGLAQDRFLLTERTLSGNITLRSVLKDGEQTEEIRTLPLDTSEKEQERVLMVMTAKLLEKYSGTSLGWGILTGIRPVKLIEQAFREKAPGEAECYLREKLLVSDDKIALAKKIIAVQKKPLETLKRGSFSLYVAIPFCPARCSYCSFVSHSLETAAKLIPEYVEKLAGEIRTIAAISKGLGFTLDTVYFGGGTPTVLTAAQLETLFRAVESFDLSALREYTVEAGRPDTITREKLAAIKAASADRISINPQTMVNSVLEAVGRKHTAEDIISAFELAVSMGFETINCDLIAGLPTDTPDGFRYSLDRVTELSPANITVHNLSIKRAANLYYDEQKHIPSGIGEMIAYSQEKLMNGGYNPYYLYRQKNSAENHENIGYARDGKESLYNIYIMEEKQPIFAAGSSGSTKLVDFDSGKIERIMNFKFPYEYISRFDELMGKKRGITEFYKKEKNNDRIS